MIARLKALVYALFHPKPIQLTVVRRYLDAQRNFIGELYEDGKMIGMSCDSMPFTVPAMMSGRLFTSARYDEEFSRPMPDGLLRLGGKGPEDHADVVKRLSLIQYCHKDITILNRFVEHILESNYVRK